MNEQVEEPEENDWLPEETKKRIAQLPDYQRRTTECEACQ